MKSKNFFFFQKHPHEKSAFLKFEGPEVVQDTKWQISLNSFVLATTESIYWKQNIGLKHFTMF